MDLYGSQLGEVSFSGACGGSQQEEDVESCVLIAAIPGGERLSMHWHAYQWVDVGVHRSNEVVRQPLPLHAVTSMLSPRRGGDWLSGPGSRVGRPLVAGGGLAGRCVRLDPCGVAVAGGVAGGAVGGRFGSAASWGGRAVAGVVVRWAVRRDRCGVLSEPAGSPALSDASLRL
jgi:hypothetical protein